MTTDDAIQTILATIAELKLAGIPVPIGLRRAAHALNYARKGETCLPSIRAGAVPSTRH
jgi:hypothetical protein